MDLLEWSSGLVGYLWVSIVLLILGIWCILSRKNAIGVLLGIELVLNAAALNFVAFSKFSAAAIDGQVFALFIILVAAAESAVGLAIVLRLFHLRQNIDTDEVTLMRN